MNSSIADMRRSKIRQGVLGFLVGPERWGKGNAIRMAAEPGGRAFLIGIRVYLPEPENPNSALRVATKRVGGSDAAEELAPVIGSVRASNETNGSKTGLSRRTDNSHTLILNPSAGTSRLFSHLTSLRRTQVLHR